MSQVVSKRRMHGAIFAAATIVVCVGWRCLSTQQHEPVRATEQHPFTKSSSVATTVRVASGSALPSAVPDMAPQHARLAGIVQSVTGRPLPRAKVCVLAAADPCCAPSACVSSDRAGRFSIDANITNPSTVVASAEGHLPLRQPLTQPTPDEALVLTLEPGGVQVTGSVVDASGGPVVDAILSATRAGEPAPALATTLSSGEFVLTVAAGTIQLSARADGYSSIIRRVEAPADGLELVLTPSSSLRGSVLSEGTEEPMAGVEVTALNANGLNVGLRSTTTDEGGAFQISELPAGSYWVQASSAEWRSVRRWVVLEVAEAETLDLLVAAATRVTASVRAGDAPCKGGFVTLTRGPESAFRELDTNGRVEFLGVLPGTYRAQVRCGPGLELTEDIDVGREPVAREWDLDRGLALTGWVTTWEGAPLANERVEVYPIGEPASRPSVYCDSDERGAFSCLGLEPGEYECQLRENADAPNERARVRLREGSAAPEVVLRANPTGTLSVRIESTESLAMDAFAVVAQKKGAAPLMAERTGAEFIFKRLPLGVYEVMLDPEVPRGRRTVELAHSGGVVQLSLSAPAGRALSGRIVDESGQGVPDVWIRVSGTSLYGGLRPASPVMSDADGAFSVPGLLPGTYELSATSQRGEARLDEVANDGHSVIVPLRTFGSMSGSVTQSDGTPVPYFVVTYGRLDMNTLDRVAGHHGEWVLPWLEPGTYALTVTAAQGNGRTTVDVAPGSASTLALSLTPPLLEAAAPSPSR